MGEKMTAIVAKGETANRVFISPTAERVEAARGAEPKWRPLGRLPERALSIRVQNYGFEEWRGLFTQRQLTALTTFGDLVTEVRALIIEDGASNEYANAICAYLALAVSRLANGNSSFAKRDNSRESGISGVFARHAIPMVWDFAEANPFSDSAQNWDGQVDYVAAVLERLPLNGNASEAR